MPEWAYGCDDDDAEVATVVADSGPSHVAGVLATRCTTHLLIISCTFGRS